VPVAFYSAGGRGGLDKLSVQRYPKSKWARNVWLRSGPALAKPPRRRVVREVGQLIGLLNHAATSTWHSPFRMHYPIPSGS
jgi:hypothetical protein